MESGSSSRTATVGVASSSQLAADAGRVVADAGGNAVDAALAALLVSMVTEPGVCDLGGGGYITVAHPDDGVAWTVDCSMEMPGRDAPPDWFGRRSRVVRIAYGGGLETTVGYESVATPGAVAGVEDAWRRWGSVPWRVLWEPAISIARTGFPLGGASASYLTHAREPIYSWHPASRAAVHHADGRPIVEGEQVRPEGRVAFLEAMVEGGADEFYRGDVAAAIAEEFTAHGGLMGRMDLAAYRTILRRSATYTAGSWTVSTNPPPAIGGVALLAVLALTLGDEHMTIHDAQRLVVAMREGELDPATDRAAATQALLDRLQAGDLRSLGSPSTVHTSAIDRSGLACAATVSAGYGSGVMPAGTGIWFNNSLGEAELNVTGYHTLRPGTRLSSNMAPTVARTGEGDVIAIGSPGADRITSALQQVLTAVIAEGADLQDAIDRHRCHVELTDIGPRLACEPDAVPVTDLPTRIYDGIDMFFGGATAAAVWHDGALEVAADPRRTGGKVLV